MNDWLNLDSIEAIARAKVEGWEIEFRAHETYVWRPWKGETWSDGWLFQGRPQAAEEDRRYQ